MIVERDDLLTLRSEQMQEREIIIVNREALIVDRDELLELRTQQMVKHEQMIDARDNQIKQGTDQIEQDAIRLVQQEKEIQRLSELTTYRGSFNWWLRLPWVKLKRLVGESS